MLNQFRNSKFEDLVNSYQSPVSVVAVQSALWSTVWCKVALCDITLLIPSQTDSLYDKLLSSIDKSFSAMEQRKVATTGPIMLNGGDLSSEGTDQTDPGMQLLSKSHGDALCHADTTSSVGESLHSEKWRIYDNPLLSLCDISEINSRGPPLFALRFPDLFVY